MQEQTKDPAPAVPATPAPAPQSQQTERFVGLINIMFRISVVVIAVVIVLVIVVAVGRSLVYKVHPYERGLHMRAGRFLTVDEPGWHFQIPLWDTVYLVQVNERLGYIDQLRAVTSDDLTMLVSLEYTYRVTEPARFALEVDNPERILFEFVQGKLRDVINTMQMADVMHGRAELNDQLLDELKAKETQYGVQFVTVQMQSASPPENVMTAIENRMVAGQLQEQAAAEAAQTRVIADAEFYAAQKRADAAAYEIVTQSEAQQLAAHSMLAALEDYPDLASQYLDYLKTLALQSNSKWVIGGSGGTPFIDMREMDPVPPAPAAPTPNPQGE